jgi:hypothetical protein
MGATWIALTPFGRVRDLDGEGVDPTFEAPFQQNVRDVARAVDMAHARGLRVMLVPHLWVESGKWRALIDPGSDRAWARWSASYEKFVRAWAVVAEAAHVEMLSAGVELRSWVTTAHAPAFAALVRRLRGIYGGLLTYSANWDDVDTTAILGDVDVIGINGFYPLADQPGAPAEELARGAIRVRERVRALAEAWHKPVLFTETGYTTRSDPAVRPWEWPDEMAGVKVDEAAQAAAYRALLAPLLRRVLRVAGLRRPRRHLAGGAVGLLAPRQAGGARRARRVRGALGLRPVVAARPRAGRDGRGHLSVKQLSRVGRQLSAISQIRPTSCSP